MRFQYELGGRRRSWDCRVTRRRCLLALELLARLFAALLQLLRPGDDVDGASVTGVRQVFNLTGGVFSTALISLVMTHFKGDEVDGYKHVFMAIAVIYVCIVPIVFIIPDTARQRRRAALASPDGAGMGAGEPEAVSRVAHSDF